jgi:hypothetical protein
MDVLVAERTNVEMTADLRFEGRVRRLVAVSSIALGVVFLLALDAIGWASGASAMIGLGWITMPTILAASLRRPKIRYLLAVPATLVSLGVLVTALVSEGGGAAFLGWWMMTAGIGFGAGLGMWFWFRWMPVPELLDRPFSAARWSLIGVHVTLIVAGLLVVFFGAVV